MAIFTLEYSSKDPVLGKYTTIFSSASNLKMKEYQAEKIGPHLMALGDNGLKGLNGLITGPS